MQLYYAVQHNLLNSKLNIIIVACNIPRQLAT